MRRVGAQCLLIACSRHGCAQKGVAGGLARITAFTSDSLVSASVTRELGHALDALAAWTPPTVSKWIGQPGS